MEMMAVVPQKTYMKIWGIKQAFFCPKNKYRKFGAQ